MAAHKAMQIHLTVDWHLFCRTWFKRDSMGRIQCKYADKQKKIIRM